MNADNTNDLNEQFLADLDTALEEAGRSPVDGDPQAWAAMRKIEEENNEAYLAIALKVIEIRDPNTYWLPEKPEEGYYDQFPDWLANLLIEIESAATGYTNATVAAMFRVEELPKVIEDAMAAAVAEGVRTAYEKWAHIASQNIP